eukprot:CAMPEP_0170074788 /NCGR_PEP_ID=MMETSP0019_2-20121128/12040_1 /TAXON_ID=98059 /ORGANISM="Dinobryon sp., Strain UTEXLB2267" /LENGTH=250 /DNA_ID=CAMNT_0010285337 /DNA_START=24 /DNA_END=776 /DNA_ORIENTATION=+
MLILVGMGRHYIQLLLKSDPIINESSLNEMKYKQILGQSARLRMHGNMLNDRAYGRRKAYFVRKTTGVLREKVPGPSNPMSNPLAMMDMMKGNIMFMVQNFVLMGFVSSFFSGFVCLKIPFPLPSTHFKLMLQRDVNLSTLDVSYVSSLSWYFIVTFGLNGVYRLLLGDEGGEFEDMSMMQMQQMGAMGGNQMGFDASAAYKQEREWLSLARHHWIGAEDAEKILLGDAYPDGNYSGGSQSIDLSSFNEG